MPALTSTNAPDYAFSEERMLAAMRDVAAMVPTQCSLYGMRVVETPHATERVADWSRCRSPARARRRTKLGHRQHVQMTERPAAYLTSLPRDAFTISPTGRLTNSRPEMQSIRPQDLVVHPDLMASLRDAIDRQNEQLFAKLIVG